MVLHHSNASVVAPDGSAIVPALARVTHLGIGAHHDDLEFMAFHGITTCYHSDTRWFGGVVCTDGGGSARTGLYARFNDQEMRSFRRQEQTLAASIGRYSVMIQLDYPSAVAKDPQGMELRDDLTAILQATRPQIVYTHNLADKHETHVGVAVATIQAIRALPAADRPEIVYGCEVWRNLDWMLDKEKIAHDLSHHDNLAATLNGVFDSQIAGGKRYDLGVIGRRMANATFFNSHTVDQAHSIAFAMDLSPLAHDDSLDIADYADGFIERFRKDVQGKLRKRLGGLK